MRDLIRESGRTDHALAAEAGIDPGSFSRFMAGSRDWQLGTAELVAAVLGVELVAPHRRPRAGTRPRLFTPETETETETETGDDAAA